MNDIIIDTILEVSRLRYRRVGYTRRIRFIFSKEQLWRPLTKKTAMPVILMKEMDDGGIIDIRSTVHFWLVIHAIPSPGIAKPDSRQ